MAENKEKIDKVKMAQTEEFLRMAWCIDGEATYKKLITVEGKLAFYFELTDSKRGTFFVSMSK